MGVKITQAEIMQLLDKLYDQSVHGIAKVSPPIEVLANNYLEESKDTSTAAKKFIICGTIRLDNIMTISSMII